MYYNKGYMIQAKHSDNKRAFSIWHGMLRRCYDKKHVKYQYYGGRGVKVCDRWKCFDYFLEDINKIDGWDTELFNSKELVLDKDGKGHNSIYDLENCQWITRERNLRIRNDSNSNIKYFKAISPTGEIFIDYNQKKFCEEHSLTPSLVSRVLKNEREHHKKWKFTYL